MMVMLQYAEIRWIVYTLRRIYTHLCLLLEFATMLGVYRPILASSTKLAEYGVVLLRYWVI
jgi:NADH:ubiquinone oxidoreductase subunit D